MMSDTTYQWRHNQRQAGSVMLMPVFVIAFLAVVVMGLLELNTADIQIMQNDVFAVQARMIAEAGLNDAISEIRSNANWEAGFSNKPFAGGTYTVTVHHEEIESTGTTSQGFQAKVAAKYVVASGTPPYRVQLGALRLNEKKD